MIEVMSSPGGRYILTGVKIEAIILLNYFFVNEK